MGTQQYVILGRADADGGSPPVLGTREDLVERLASLNTSPERPGEDVLYGPGIRIEFPPGEPVTQMLLTVVEEEIAWQVIMRLAKALDWKLFDPATGRELAP